MPGLERPKILLVDDDPLVLDLLQTVLDEGEFEVIAAGDAASAMEVLQQDGGGLAGLVTDVDLGAGLSGWDLAREARGRRPSAAIVYTTGANGHEWEAKGVPGSVLLTKPFPPVQSVVALLSQLNQDGLRQAG